MKQDLILFARREDGSLAGFLFGLPNYVEGADPKTAILKSYTSAERGVGHCLADRFHRAALSLGLTTTIHALIHEYNASLARSRMHSAEIFRRYALFGRVL
ncbi:MAG: hypothetical protein AAGE61_07545 [Pseudomonadota bacterium]